MPNATREIRRRIKSVGNTRKVTKAMELVSSAKMRRAVQSVLGTRPYADEAWKMLMNLSRKTEAERHPLLQERPQPKKIGVVLIATNRGLVGGFNTQIVSAVSAYIRAIKDATLADVEVALMGSRGKTIFFQHGHNVVAEFTKEDVMSEVTQIRPMANMMIQGFINGTYDRVIVGYMDYISTLVQKPRIRQILPLTEDAFREGRSGLIGDEERSAIEQSSQTEAESFDYAFEPSADIVIEQLFPRLVEMQIFRAVLETNASEHAARMIAMRNASDAADDLIDDLTLSFNQARQAAITQDLSEISAGRAALES